MCVERSVTGRTSQILTLTEGNVLVLTVLVALSQTEINDINVVLCAFGSADQEVVRFDIPMDNPFFMHFLNALNLNQILINGGLLPFNERYEAPSFIRI